ncbi:MAG: transporter substrate-binding domain-containing protein [Alphaproteobacteria bacterium]
MYRWFCRLTLFVCLSVTAALPSTHATELTLRSGWYLWDPYQYLESRNNHQTLTGLDIELVRAIAARVGVEVAYERVAWRQHLADLAAGTRHMAAGATWSPERAEYAWFSIPYRSETNVLYVPAGKLGLYGFHDVEGMLAHFKAIGFRLGVVDGFVYADPRINDWIADPANAPRLVHVGDEYANLRNLAAGRIDGFLADRVVAATSAWRGGWRQVADEHPLRISVPIHLMFSKKSVDQETVARFNAAIEEMRETGHFNGIVADYVFPVLLAQTMDRGWFTVIDLAAIVAFALSGIVLAYRGRYDIFGALVLAAMPAVGGGLMRDLVAGRSPPAVVAEPAYLLLVCVVVGIGYVVLKSLPRMLHADSDRSGRVSARMGQVFNWTVTVCDAAGLAFLTVVGVVVAVATRLEPLWLWGAVLAMLGGGGGGILRDIVRQERDIPSLKGEIYPEIALFWGFLLSLYLVWQTRSIDPDYIFLGILVTMVGAFLTRMAVVMLRLKSPLYG